VTSPPKLWKTSRAARWAALIGLALFAIAPALMLAPAHASDDGEISALTMRQYWRGVEEATMIGDVLYNTDTSKYPYANTCWGAFSTLHQEGLLVEDMETLVSMFLPGVCMTKNGHGQAATVLVAVFTHYVDQHPQVGGDRFVYVAWKAFKAAWPCTR
jgi:hypothetical protein